MEAAAKAVASVVETTGVVATAVVARVAGMAVVRMAAKVVAKAAGELV